MNYRIIKNKKLNDYKKKYSNYNNLKKVSKIDADKNISLLNGKIWWLIDDVYYEAPSRKDKIALWWMHLGKSGRVAICVLSSIAVASAVVVPTTIAIINKNKSAAVSSLKLNKTKLDLEVGKTFKLVATTEPEGAAVSYESSNPNKVSVAKDGTITANEVVEEDNKVIITAKSGDKTATCEVTTYNIYEIDWATTSFNNPALGFDNETVYDKALLAKKVEFVKDKDSTNGVCVGEVKANGQDRVYASFSNELLKIWSPGKIALDDDDKGQGSEGTFYGCNEIISIDFSNIDTH